MDKFQKELMLNEVKKFKHISQKYKYSDINELIGHYIEEDIIESRKELIKIANLIRGKLGINITTKTFKDCWVN
jgi:hypothetical protein